MEFRYHLLHIFNLSVYVQVFRERETSGPYVPKPIFIFVPLFLTQEDCSSLSHVNNRARR